MAALGILATLLLALGGPPLLAIVAGRVLDDTSGLTARLAFDLVMWVLLGLILSIVVGVERQPLASIGLRRPGWSTVFYGLLLAAGMSFVLVPAMIWLVGKSGLPGYDRGLRHLLPLPAWYRAFLAVTAGVVEEPLYRGYAVERLASLTGSYWLGGALAVVASGLAHIPTWGPGPALVALAAAGLATLFYLWKRDLVALMIAHVIVDAVGLLFLPPAGAG